MKHIAGIDIGTNTLLLLIATQLDNGSLIIQKDEHRIARLGEGLQKTAMISEVAISRACTILKEYAAILSSFPTIDVRAVATSAMRDAHNSTQVLSTLMQSIGYPIEVISGTEEAALTFLGSREMYGNPVVIDIGGGSTEIIQLVDNEEYCQSFNIGAVRLKENVLQSMPMSLHGIHQAKQYVKSIFEHCKVPRDSTIIVTAGTPTTLAAMDLALNDLSSPLIHGHVLSLSVISKYVQQLLHSTLEEIMTIPGVHPQRADILPAGSLILESILEVLQIDSCIVSKKGLRYGLIMSLL